MKYITRWNLVFLLIFIIILSAYYIDKTRHERYINKHNCKIVSEGTITATPVITYNGLIGTAITEIPSKWVCEDGEEFWR